MNDDIRSPRLTQKFDVVLCISVLEHIKEHRQAVASMMKLLNPGGHLILTHPYHESRHIENVYDLPGSYGRGMPYPAQQYSRANVDEWLALTKATLVDQEYWQFFAGDNAWSCGDLVRPPKQSTNTTPHQLTCMVLRNER